MGYLDRYRERVTAEERLGVPELRTAHRRAPEPLSFAGIASAALSRRHEVLSDRSKRRALTVAERRELDGLDRSLVELRAHRP